MQASMRAFRKKSGWCCRGPWLVATWVAGMAAVQAAEPPQATWLAGVARADITPRETVPLAGYGGPTRLSQRVEHPIWIKALALQDAGGQRSVLVTADLVGLSAKMTERIAADALANHRIPRERLLLNASHNHSCPITEDVLWLYYDLAPEEQAARDRYTQFVYAQYDRAIGDALARLEPAELAFEQGLAGFAVNRRRSRGRESRSLPGPVDHDVPVLKVTAGGALRAVAFGYACHTTALGGREIHGDYAGFAQQELERLDPGCVALFVQNCGGDANPLPRDHRTEAGMQLARSYGYILAQAVRQVLDGPLRKVSGPLRVAGGETQLDLQPGPSRAALQQQAPRLTGMARREVDHLLRQYDEAGEPPARVRYPIQVWKFGDDLTWIALTGETVVDYGLKFKAAYGAHATWVSGYHNDLLSYVPSLRVLREGGYEGGDGMREYGHRAPYAESVERRITEKVEQLTRQAAAAP